MQTAAIITMNTANEKEEFLSSEKTEYVQISPHFLIWEEAWILYFREVIAQATIQAIRLDHTSVLYDNHRYRWCIS